MRPVERAALVTHGRTRDMGPAIERLQAAARAAGVELVPDGDDATAVDLAVVPGGDGTMLRALQRFLGTNVPVIGVNFGRVGFLASIQPNELESGLARVFSGDYRVVELTTLDVEADSARAAAVNDVVVLSSTRGRMIEL